MRLLLTGTPGCGKTVFSKKLARALDAKVVDVNSLVEKRKLYRTNARKEKIVDLTSLQKILRETLAKGKNVVVESHLLCEMSLPCDEIIVLRCDPLVLKKRLEKRGYPAWKVKENATAELLDYCSIKTSENYAKIKVLEVDFTRPLPVKSVLSKKKSDAVDWMRDFALVQREIKGFLE